MRRAWSVVMLLSGVLAVSFYVISCRTGSPGSGGQKGSGGQNEPTAADEHIRKTGSFQADIEAYCRLLHLPSLAVGVARGDSLIFFSGFGNADPDAGDNPPTADHIFPIASVTKTLTTVALKQIEGEGKLSLQDPISSFPNQFFTENRWDGQTTLAHIISHTSESEPHGTQFVYNGSKFNIAFNAFQAINTTNDPDDITQPFTQEIQHRILTPLHMDHTLLRYAEKEHGHLQKWIAPAYRLDDSAGKFIPADIDLNTLQSGPGYGMMSSVNDLIRFSSALGRNKLLTDEQYNALTTPFYPGSPYGQGWFTTRFEGTDIHWAYGYGSTDAALLLRIPSTDLTLIILAPCALPSATTRLGYGNPFNSTLVCSFFRNFVQQNPTSSRLPVEEKFAEAATLSFMPASLHPDTARARQLLQTLITNFPTDTIWQTPAAFELVATSENPAILRFGLKMADRYLRQNHVHPVKAWYSGLIYQKNRKWDKAQVSFEALAWGDQYREQPYKFNAMMELAKRYKLTAPRHSKEILQDLVRFKEYININDQQRREAEELLKDLQKG